jgi:hypothetical protein
MPDDIIPTLHGYRYRKSITAATHKICAGVLNFIRHKFQTHKKKEDGSVVNAINSNISMVITMLLSKQIS